MCTYHKRVPHRRSKHLQSIYISSTSMQSLYSLAEKMLTLSSAFSVVNTVTRLQLRLCSTANAMPVLERKIVLKNRPPVHIVRTGHLDEDGTSPCEHAVLLIPGVVGTAWTDFRPTLEKLPLILPPTWSVIACDMPGRGKSRPPHEVMPLDGFERNAAAAGEVMEALGIDNYSVLGWSGGSVSAITMAVERPQNVKKLILTGTTPCINTRMLDFFESKFQLRLWFTSALPAVKLNTFPTTQFRYSWHQSLAQFIT